ncbi:MAG: DUF5686 and carboxypeptidase regulatory-like domain-containing protein, partial [Cyclobacteriaceae bacterium]
ILLIIVGSFAADAQSISGFVLNEKNEPVPFVNIFVRETSSGTSTDATGKYYLAITPGSYHFVISAIGYENKQLDIVIGDGPQQKNIYLRSSDIALEELVIKAKRKDPAVEIIQLAIKNRDKYQSAIQSFKSDVYIKATEVIDEKEKKRRAKVQVTESQEGEAETLDLFSKEETATKEAIAFGKISLMEVQLTLNYQAPNRYKEERTGYLSYGTKAGLFIPTYGESDFNFYKNLVNMNEIMEVPVISPISRTAILTYKYKLVETLVENDQLVYKISITPRKSGSSSVKGHIYINDGLWNINRIDVSLDRGGLKIYDKFNIRLDYELTDSIWIQKRLEFKYETSQGKYKNFRGNTLIKYRDMDINYEFPEKFFNNEVSVIKQEAYDRDSTYWNATRPEPLNQEEQALIHYKDSIHNAVNSKEYQDSIQQAYNKIKFMELFLEGVGFRNNEKKSHLYLSSVTGMIGFEPIGGFRFSPYAGYFRRLENGKMLNAFGGVSVGFRNSDVQGNFNYWMRYDPHHLGDISIAVGRAFYSINSFDAYLNQLRASNFILHDRLTVTHRRELFNGFYAHLGFNLNDRKSLEGYDTDSFINGIGVIEDTETLEFEDYRAIITEARISYTPGQRFMTEPNRKIILGSKYPTFSLTHRKGWNDMLSSDIDFDFLGFSVTQDVVFGVLGNSKYKFETGKFINTNDLREIDIKRFRESDPILYSDPLNSFQILNEEIFTSDFFLEYHHIHHFNGALINNVPFIKKTRLRVVAGGGALWLPEEDFRYQELFAGLERTFKLGARRRLRLGVYGAVAESNRSKPDANFKISFDIIDTWKRDWSF